MTTQAEKDAILAELNWADGYLATAEPLVAPYASIAADVNAAQAAVASAVLETQALPVEPPIPPPPVLTLDIARFGSTYEGSNGANPAVLSPSIGQVDAEPDPTRAWTTPFDFVWNGVVGLAPTFKVRLKWGVNSIFGDPSWYTSASFMSWFSQDDGLTWQRCASTVYDPVAQVITITPSTVPFVLDTLRVAEAPPYTETLYAADRARWTATGFCADTVIGTSVQGRAVFRHTITDPSAPASGKKAIYLYFSGHEQERHAAWRLKGLIDWLTGSSAEAATARRRVVAHVVLRSNPDAYVNGWMRCTATGIQTNRWNVGPPSLSVEGQEQYAVHADVEARAVDASPLRVFVDFHTSQASGEIITPESAALAALPVAFFAPGRLKTPIVAQSWPQGGYSDQVVKSRVPGVMTAFFDTAGTRYLSGELVSSTTAQEVGVSLIRALDAWLVGN